MRTRFLAFLATLGFIALNSCNNDSDMAQESSLTQKEVLTEGKIDKSIDDVNEIVNGEFDFGFSARGDSNPWMPTCAVITTTQVENTWTRTIDFGTEGCELPNGNIVKGKIIMSFTFETGTSTRIISNTFENFYHNGRNLNGFSTTTRTNSNINGNPESKQEVDLTLTLENGDVYTRKGFKMREWTEGSDTAIRSDDVHIFTGTWTTTTPSKTISTTITNPLKKIGTCEFFVEGTIEYKKNADVSILDFGNGECDSKATLTINGGAPTEINLED